MGRKRRTAGWTLLTLGVLVAGVLVASGFISLSRFEGTYAWGVGAGSVWYQTSPGTSGQFGWVVQWRDGPSVRWQFVVHPYEDVLWRTSWDAVVLSKQDSKVLPGRAPFNMVRIDGLLWPLVVLFGGTAALLLRAGILARRRAMTNTCARCGYSLAGLGNDSSCPECGKRTIS